MVVYVKRVFYVLIDLFFLYFKLNGLKRFILVIENGGEKGMIFLGGKFVIRVVCGGWCNL